MTGVTVGCGDDDGDLPAAERPQLVNVLDRPEGSPATARNDGAFAVLPARAVEMRVRAAWPANLDISLDTGETLTSVPVDDQQSASELDQQDIGHWSTKAIDVNATPATWTILVAPPRTRRLNSQRIGVLIRHVSQDQSVPPERRISEPLTVVLGRVGPQSGTLSVNFEPEDSDNAASAWVADLGALTGALPRAAEIETVRNDSSLTRTGDLGDERDDTALNELRYTVVGQTRSTTLAARQISSALAGLRTTGTLRARRPPGEALCIPLGTGPRRGSVNEAPCGRPDVGLWVDWRTP